MCVLRAVPVGRRELDDLAADVALAQGPAENACSALYVDGLDDLARDLARGHGSRGGSQNAGRPAVELLAVAPAGSPDLVVRHEQQQATEEWRLVGIMLSHLPKTALRPIGGPAGHSGMGHLMAVGRQARAGIEFQIYFPNFDDDPLD